MQHYLTVQDGHIIYKNIRVKEVKPAIQLSIDAFVVGTRVTDIEFYFQPFNSIDGGLLLPNEAFQDGYFHYVGPGLQAFRFAFDGSKVPVLDQVIRCQVKTPPWHNGDGRTIAIKQVKIEMVD